MPSLRDDLVRLFRRCPDFASGFNEGFCEPPNLPTEQPVADGLVFALPDRAFELADKEVA